MHIGDVDHEHDDALDDDDRRAMERAILAAETLQLLTVGIDIGSSTAHLLFARVFFQRQAHRLSDRFVAVNREVVWRSPILLTPFRPDGTIDADELSRFVDQCYRDAGIAAADVDSGAVILTGEAIKRRNARSIDEIFAGQSGRFVCATAGHRLEAILAGHGSGATALSRRRRACGLHVDIGGGTTKLALIDRGEIVGVAAFAIGGRLLAQDPHGAWTRIDESAVRVATDLGLGTTPAAMAADATRTRIVQRMAELVVDQITRGAVDDLGRDLELTDPLERTLTPEYITFSGGVAEYILGDERREFGDIARPLAAEIVKQLRDRVSIPTVDIDQRIRATVIGASQFTVQLSGKTVHIDEAGALPLRNVPVVRLARPLIGDIDPDQVADTLIRHAGRQDTDLAGPVALAVAWTGPVSHRRVHALACGITRAADLPSGENTPLIVVIDADIAQALGAILHEEAGLRRPVIVLDGIDLRDLDFLDVGAYLDPPGVVAVVIKSLLFSHGT